jgi:flagellar biosynthesis repressor protein FlbT
MAVPWLRVNSDSLASLQACGSSHEPRPTLVSGGLARSVGSTVMPLKLSLKPGERFVLNGAVVQNGDRRGVLVLQNKASVLREKDIMQADEATTPARRIYFPVMMMYLDEANAKDFYDDFAQRMSEFMGVIRNAQILTECVAVSKHVLGHNYYKALMSCRRLIEYEDERLGNVSSGVPAGGAAE